MLKKFIASLLLIVNSLNIELFASNEDEQNLTKLAKAYPTFIKTISNNELIFTDNNQMMYSDFIENKTYEDMLNNPSLKDQMSMKYIKIDENLNYIPSKNEDAGRIRYEPFFKKMYEKFEPANDKLLETAIAKLGDDEVWKKNPHKKRSLINAFALTYADMDIYKGSFTMFLDKEKLSNLKYVCFNSTEFSFGLAFRFQNTGLFGNKALSNKHVNELEGLMQLGDIAASSSCFPLGFEPLVFPDDYVKDQQTTAYKAVKSLERFADGVGIMDGGIADNQGIGSMMNISAARKRDNELNRELDLIVINDVGSFKMNPWKPEAKKKDESASINSTISKV